MAKTIEFQTWMGDSQERPVYGGRFRPIEEGILVPALYEAEWLP